MIKVVIRSVAFCGVLLFFISFPTGSSGMKLPVPSISEMIVIEGTGPKISTHSERSFRIKQTAIRTPLIDFNCDRRGDTASASTIDTETINQLPIRNIGAVNVLLGAGTGGPGRKGNQQLTIRDFGIEPNEFALFGGSIAAGDFNNDLCTDLAVGVPGAVPEFGNAVTGAIAIYTGSRKGLVPDQLIYGNAGDLLGASLTSGDFNGDGFWDFASGAIGTTVKGKRDAGSVYTFYGSEFTLNAGLRWDLSSGGIRGKPKAQSFFGQELQSIDINHDSYWDLIIGTPAGNNDKGFSNVLYGSANGITNSGNQRILLGNRKVGDAFGFSLATVYSNDDDFGDVLFGAPGLDLNTGGVFLLTGSNSGLTSTDALYFRSPSTVQGDRFGYSMATAGLRANNIYAFGSPDANVTIGGRTYQNGGAVNVVRYDGSSSITWHTLTNVGSKLPRNDFDRWGFSLGFSFNSRSNRLTMQIGVPGAAIGGKDFAGAFVSYTVRNPYQSDLSFTAAKIFHLNRLKGSNQDNAQFGIDLLHHYYSW